jgi:hypothetical protein
MNRGADDAARLQDITATLYDEGMSRDEARSAVIDVVTDRLRCTRVSLWKFEGEVGALSLLCFASKVAGGPLDTSERRLDEAEYRAYFNSLIERGVFVTADAMNEPALQALREPYLVANNVLSMLDAVFTLNGRAYGMICCEETKSPRTWRAADVASLRAIVNKLALLMSGAEDPVLWATPSLPLRTLAAPGAIPSPSH